MSFFRTRTKTLNKYHNHTHSRPHELELSIIKVSILKILRSMFSHLPLHPKIIFLSLIYFYAHAVSVHLSWISNCILFGENKTFLNQHKLFWWVFNSGRNRGRVWGICPPFLPWELTLVWEFETEILACVQTPPFLHRQAGISLFNWLIFFNDTGAAFCH